MIRSWNIDLEEHGSDHLPTFTTWDIHHGHLTTSPAWKRVDLNKIHHHFQQTYFPPLCSNPQQTLEITEMLYQAIETATNLYNPLTRPGCSGKVCRSPNLSLFRTTRRQSARNAKSPIADPEVTCKAKEEATRWKEGIRAATWAHWEFTPQDTTCSNVWRTFIRSLQGSNRPEGD